MLRVEFSNRAGDYVRALIMQGINFHLRFRIINGVGWLEITCVEDFTRLMWKYCVNYVIISACGK